MRILNVIMLLFASTCLAWNSGDDLSSSTNWRPLTQAMRSRSVMNMHDGYTPWYGASWWMSHRYATNTLPSIDPYWWNPNGLSTNGGWVWKDGYTDMAFDDDATVTGSRRYNFSAFDSRNPYIAWYVYEAQTHVQNWFNNGRVVAQGTETAWDGSVGGSNLTLQAALELTGMTDGVVRSYEMGPDTNTLIVSGSLTPDVAGVFLWDGLNWERGGGVYINENPITGIFELRDDTAGSMWTNQTAEGTYYPSLNATGTATAVYGETYAFTNGWAASGDFIGFWQRDDLTNLLSVMKRGWYVPDKDAGLYYSEDQDNRFYGQESIPLYLRSGSYQKWSSWSTNYVMGFYDTKIDLIVTNTVTPDCDGYYLADYLAAYGRFDGGPRISVLDQDGPLQNWAIHDMNGYVVVSSAPAPWSSANGSYTASGPSFTNTLYNQGDWRLKDFNDQFVLWDRSNNELEYLYNATGAVSPDATGHYNGSTLANGSWQIFTNDFGSGNHVVADESRGGEAFKYVFFDTNDVLNPDVTGMYSYDDGIWKSDGYWIYKDGIVWWIGESGSTDSSSYGLYRAIKDVGSPFNLIFSGGFAGTNTAGSTGGVAFARQSWVKSGTTIEGEYPADTYWATVDGQDYNTASGTLYIAKEANAFVGTNLWGQYIGEIDYAGATCDVHVAYFHRQGIVTGLYANIGTATSVGTAEVLAGPGWTNPFGKGEATEENALLWIAENYDDLLTDNTAAMTDFDGPNFSVFYNKGGHYRSLQVSPYEVITVPAEPNPTNVFKVIYLGIYENNEQNSPACTVAHRFGDGSYIDATHGLPAITNVHLFNESGYYTNSFGLSYAGGNTFPFIDYSLINFESNRTFFAEAYNGITTNNYTDYNLVNDSISINFVGWVMEFE